MGLGDRYIVVGGAGFLGSFVVRLLAERGDSVTAFDLRPASYPDYPSVRILTGDITDIDSVRNAIKGHNIVIHTASPIHSSKPELYYKVNVDGTKNVLNACNECEVEKLIYTSSASVVYSGANIYNGDETMSYPKVPIDSYNDSKAIAEQLVLKFNGSGGVLTTAIRPSGVYGPVENQFLDALYDMVKSGRNYKFYLGSNINIFDYTDVENVAYAHILAADKLNKYSGVAGETFNITDDSPRPFWDVHKDFYNHMGVEDSHSINIPGAIAFFLAYMIEFFVKLLSPIREIHPTFSLFRVRFSVANRYFSIEKAKRLLGYEPRITQEEGLKRAGLYYKKKWESEREALKDKKTQ